MTGGTFTATDDFGSVGGAVTGVDRLGKLSVQFSWIFGKKHKTLLQ